MIASKAIASKSSTIKLVVKLWQVLQQAGAHHCEAASAQMEQEECENTSMKLASVGTMHQPRDKACRKSDAHLTYNLATSV